MNNSKSYLAVSHFLGAVFMLALPWAAAAQTIDTDTTTPITNSDNNAAVTITASGSITTTSDGIQAIISTGTGATLTSDGSITTSGGDANGIRSEGGDAEITLGETGTIATEGDDANGIRSDGNDSTITIDGSITTAGNGGPDNSIFEDSANGIRSDGEGATITLGATGAITTGGRNADGIFSIGAGAEITIDDDGNITTTLDFADGIHSDGVNAEILNDGSITTGGNNARGIFSTGEGAEITLGENGAITTSGRTSSSNADAIYSTGDTATITIDGSITTGGRNADGIYSNGDTATISNNGSITISDVSAHAIFSAGDDATISNNGSITTSGRFADAIYLGGADAEISNDGSITTSGDEAHGIRADSEGATITNNGDIITTDTFAYGIRAGFEGATVTNNGTITTSGDTARGIFSSGADARITNDGEITTSGEGAAGILSSRSNATITVTALGTITTSGNNAHGIQSTGGRATITNDGTISTSGDDANGIFSTGNDVMIANDGTITTSGAGAHGICATGDNATITSNGTISASGNNAHGICSTGEDAEVTIEGKVSVSGEDSYVVQGGDDTDQILNLRLDLGAETQGEFDLGESEGDYDVANVWLDTSTVISSTITIGGAEIINLMPESPLPLFVSEAGDSVAIVDLTGATATRRALGTTTGQIHRQVSNRLAFAPHVGDSAADAHDGAAWGALFGGQSKRDDDGLALAFDHSFYGVVGGYDAYTDSGQRVGFFAGFGREDIKTSDIASITDTADRLFTGVYGRQSMGRLNLDGSVVLGYARHDSARLVDDNMEGRETAHGKYNSTSISPALRLSWSHALASGLELRPSAHSTYTHGSYGSYTESGTTNSDLSFGKRNVGITDARLQLAVAQSFLDAQGEIELRGGATFTHYGKDSVNARWGEGATTSHAVPGDRTVSGGFVGATLHYAVKDRVNLDGTIEYTETSGDRSGALSGQLMLVLKF
ncbi:autotransporter outer membrane beta-barrel domain-containing protein [Kiloniella sp.]|uniref:autotransporter outer membrane beta-barrel domain-containing protein n=1 Tax=Kiloniella sp. TaxID=1938587 RepID=UPI003B0141F3